MAKSKQTDKLTRSRRQHPRINADKIDQFLMLLNQNFSQRAAARICLLKEGSVTRLLSQPSVKERQEELKRVWDAQFLSFLAIRFPICLPTNT
jgi:hypothetical protein